ncbi:TetR/AcrR family transcriptional regulator [Sandaracinus amylolyticus]|uniref:TetR/AcrR family transcriptional regulator n=1 Tax=Sandaracinus amylolyticus TaxID=927083 RepID=UPI00069F67CA|nr:TetR/AcrR family transcriptional regulator [Sandaracinus amylolyticus]
MASRDEQRERTRRRVYECALDVFRRDGVAPCRIDDITAAAGVSRGSFYFHFPTKEHVLLERMRETEDTICDAIDALPADAHVDAVLAVLNQKLAEIWEPDPQLLPDVTGAALRLAATTMSDQEATRMRSVLAQRFRAGVERGEIVARVPPDILSDLYLGHVLAALLAWYGNRGLALSAMLSAVSDLFWNGAKSPAPPASESIKPGRARASSSPRSGSRGPSRGRG